MPFISNHDQWPHTKKAPRLHSILANFAAESEKPWGLTVKSLGRTDDLPMKKMYGKSSIRLSGWWLVDLPSEKYMSSSVGMIILNIYIYIYIHTYIWKNKTCSKPPTSQRLWICPLVKLT